MIQQWKPVCNTQFGVIAEEVAEANPERVVRDEKAELSSVRNQANNAVWLNEFLKENRKVQEQDATIAQLRRTSKRPSHASKSKSKRLLRAYRE